MKEDTGVILDCGFPSILMTGSTYLLVREDVRFLMDCIEVKLRQFKYANSGKVSQVAQSKTTAGLSDHLQR